MRPFVRTSVGRVWTAAALACLAMGLICAGTSPSSAGTPEGLSYVRAHQAPDGGFFEPGRGGAGQDSTTAWCIMALRAAGTDPNSVRNGGRSPVDFLSTQSSNWKSVTDYERTLLAAVAAGADPRSFGGVDLVDKIASHQRPGGNIGDAVNSNVFGILAYRAAGLDIPAGAVAWQKSAQNADGGWGNNPGGAGNPDMTGASIMALLAAGVGSGDPSIVSGLDYLHAIQAPDGGFSYQAGAADVPATAWCVQAIIAAGQDPGGAEWSKGGSTPWSYLLDMQAADGHFAWTAGRDMNPVWTTAYAVCALDGKPFPVAIAPARQSAGAVGAEDPSGSSSGGEAPAAGPESAAEENEQASEDERQAAASEQGAGQEQETSSAGRRVLADGESQQERRSGAWAWWLAGSLLSLLALGGGGWLLRQRLTAGGAKTGSLSR